MNEMDEIVKEFLVESNEGLDQMDRDLVELEKDPESQELLARIFRAVHTMKGTSGVLGFPKLESVAHAGESLLSRLRDGKLRLTPEITSSLLATADALRCYLKEIEIGGHEGEREFAEVKRLLAELIAQPEEKPLGEILLERNATTEDAINEALQHQALGDERKLGQILIEGGRVQPAAVLDALNHQGDVRLAAAAGNIRVDVRLLDKMMDLVGELVLARNHSLALVRLRGHLGGTLPRSTKSTAVACG
jgi:two-component system, chemotaxis family, sensor kinase CheA